MNDIHESVRKDRNVDATPNEGEEEREERRRSWSENGERSGAQANLVLH
jgi:hypothetical protein